MSMAAAFMVAKQRAGQPISRRELDLLARAEGKHFRVEIPGVVRYCTRDEVESVRDALEWQGVSVYEVHLKGTNFVTVTPI